jgi:putative molybdopterin biosynthesis protein
MQATVISIPSPKVLTPPQAASLLQISEKTLIKMAASGQIPCFRAGRLWRFPAAALEKWLESFEQICSQAA